MSRGGLAHSLGIEQIQLTQIVDGLAHLQALVSGELTEGAVDDDEVCDSAKFESLLRMARADAAPQFEALPVEQLGLFLASFHSLHRSEQDVEGLTRRMEQLLCYSAPAAQWEGEFLPARVRSYQTSMLNGVLQESNLRWLGCGSERVAFCFEPDIDLLGAATPASADDESEEAASDLPVSEEQVEPARPAVPVDDASGLFPDPFGRYDIQMLQRATGMFLHPLVEKMW